MRIAAQVFLGYALVLVLCAVLRLFPLGRGMPDVVALAAMYLGRIAADVEITPDTTREFLVELITSGRSGDIGLTEEATI